MLSYDLLLNHGGALAERRSVDLVVADEAHHLKGGKELAAAFGAVDSGARILLTATPLANNLGEFYALTTIAVPGRLGTRADFEADYVKPVAAGAIAAAHRS